MPPKPTPLDTADLVERYRAGESLADLARSCHADLARIRTALVDAGVEIRGPGAANRASGKRRLDIDETDLVRRYAEGASVLALSKALGVSRRTITDRLTAAGVELRDGSAANRLRMARMTFAERAALAAAANAARRRDGRTSPTRSPSRLKAARGIARTREVTHSAAWPVERDVITALHARGVPLRTQTAVGTYNLDLAVGDVAVEVHSASHHPSRDPRLARRTVELAEGGWSVLYVWVTDAHPFTEGCADELIAHLDEMQGLPAGVCEQRVIRGSGELAAVLRVDLDQRTLVPAPEDAP